MTTHSDFLMGRIALERGMLSVDQLADCLNDQRQAPAAPLGNILIRKGLVKKRDLDSLVDEHKRRLSEALDLTDPKLEDALLGRLLIKQGLVKEAQVYDCLRTMAEIGEKGEKSPRLGELLVRKGHLTTDAVDRTLFLPRRETLICPACRAHFSSFGTDTAKKYTCKQCGCILERVERSLPVGEETEGIRLDLPPDAAKVAKESARQFAGGKYILIQEVGQGGMGIVWKAWQTDLRRYVAIKILVGTMWTDQEIKRFYREAQMAARLSHPNIASIYEVGAHEGKHYIAMEFIDGESLARLMAPSTSSKLGTARHVKHLPPRKAIEILREVAQATDFAHSKKIIHRDLKPHNIMVQRSDGRVFVMDFGLAKPIRAKDSFTMSDAIVGTPQYMSPEQARGDEVDRRTDVFSLGAVLYHALTGRPPFDGHSPAETMMSVLADDPTPPRKLNPRVHPDVETICFKALEKDRHRRYDSAGSFADDLSRYLEGEPISARPLSPRERFWKEVKRRPVPAALVAAGFAAALLLGIILLAFHIQERSRVNTLVELALGAERQGKYEDAKGYLEQASGLDPNDRYVRALWDRTVERIRQEAEKDKTAAENRQREIAHWHRTAASFFQLKSYEDALTFYSQIVTLDPLGLDSLARERKKKCEEEIEKEKQRVAQVEKRVRTLEDEKIRVKQARQLANEKRVKAFKYYVMAQREVYTALGMGPRPGTGFSITDVKEKLQEARDALTDALRTDDTYAEAYFFRGQVRHKMGDYAMAVADFENASKFSSEKPGEPSPDEGPAVFAAAMSNLALFMLHAQTPLVKDLEARDRALEKMWDKAHKAHDNRDNPSFERFCGMALVDFYQREFAEAEGKMQNVSIEGKANYFYHFILACIHTEKGDFRAAAKQLQTALDLEPMSLEALFLTAVVKAWPGSDDLTGAERAARKAVAAAPPDHYQSCLLLASLLHQLNKSKEAMEMLDRAASCIGAPKSEINSVKLEWITGTDK